MKRKNTDLKTETCTRKNIIDKLMYTTNDNDQRSGDRDQISGDNGQLSRDNDQLSADNGQLSGDRDQRSCDNGQLSGDDDQRTIDRICYFAGWGRNCEGSWARSGINS